MGTPCGGKREEVARFLAGRHALIPWPRPEDIGTAAEVCQSFCIDNGAFTLWKSGEKMSRRDWRGYFEFCELWMRHPGCDFAIIPDVIDGDERDNDALISDWINYKPYGDPRLRVANTSEGVPVWHLHEPLERLTRLCRAWKRVAIGSSGEWPNPGTDKWWRRMAEAMEAACDKDGRPICKLHGLRMLDPAIFHRLPLASADSTNAVRNANLSKRFGMYCPPSSGARQSVIADRIEAHQSAAIWVPPQESPVFCFMELDGVRK